MRLVIVILIVFLSCGLFTPSPEELAFQMTATQIVSINNTIIANATETKAAADAPPPTATASPPTISEPACTGTQNLLENPGFEVPYVEVTPPIQGIMTEGWTEWAISATTDAPSYRNVPPLMFAPASLYDQRIHSGENALVYISFYSTHDAGVYQQVTGIEGGTNLCFSVFAYVWSSELDDINVSEEDGNVTLQVGIDPTGGTDAQSEAIIWSTPIEQYDAYRGYRVEAVSEGSAVTVFVRSIVELPVQYNYLYLDDAALYAVP